MDEQPKPNEKILLLNVITVHFQYKYFPLPEMNSRNLSDPLN